ncbi:MAG: undecaprenyl/decaprenyl-phosphate alpha-N-acetylglucosaminyl 1-phosphate transferase [Candidatus Omnitrophica bacterium]|nr:undecaprenyl/decaprenyl-phosphate alpha-N-acetylglucosaminyl 1-phosphate transferase [Candidatus Omnitrophota bacterium]
MFKPFLISTFSCALSMLFLWALRSAAMRYHILVKNKVAIVGGVGLAAAVFLPSLMILSIQGALTPRALWVPGASLLMLVLGVMDDIREQTVVQKVLIQLLCTSVLIMGGIRTAFDGLGLWGNVLFTYIWILGVTNAFNLLDVMDGVTAGAAFLVLAGILVFLGGADPAATVFLSSLLGAVAGFCVFNFPPANIYLGNAGSHFIGFFLAAIMVQAWMVPGRGISRVVGGVLIFGLPLLEMVLLIVHRSNRRLWPFQKSDHHLALRLLARGLSKQLALVSLLGIGAFFVLSGLGVGHVNVFWTAVMGAAIMGVSFCALII